jgi:hypothetical protein
VKRLTLEGISHREVCAVDVGDLLNWVALYFASLPRDARAVSLAAIGLALTLLAVPRFQERFPTALMFMGLAVGCFWMAIAAFM